MNFVIHSTRTSLFSLLYNSELFHGFPCFLPWMLGLVLPRGSLNQLFMDLTCIWKQHSLVWCMTEGGTTSCQLALLVESKSMLLWNVQAFFNITDRMKTMVVDFSLSACVFGDLTCWHDAVFLWWHLTLDFPVALYHLIKSGCAFVEKLTEKAAQRRMSPFTGSVFHLNYQFHLFHLCQTRVQTRSPIWTINYPCPWKKSLKVAIVPFLKL